MTLHDPETDRLFDKPPRVHTRTRSDRWAKTHCPHGHPYEGPNVIVTKRGTRHCRVCARAHSKLQYQKRKRAKAAREGILI